VGCYTEDAGEIGVGERSDGAAVGVEVEGDVRALDGSVQRRLAERAGLGAGQLVVALLQNEGRVSVLAAELDR
jgi:hypothetical protein